MARTLTSFLSWKLTPRMNTIFAIRRPPSPQQNSHASNDRKLLLNDLDDVVTLKDEAIGLETSGPKNSLVSLT